jgi:hypothetical protein
MAFHACELTPTLRFWIWFYLAAASLLPLSFAHADPADDSLRLYAVNIRTNYGVYLGKGLIITAAHVVGSPPQTNLRVRSAGMDLPASAIKVGNFERWTWRSFPLKRRSSPSVYACAACRFAKTLRGPVSRPSSPLQLLPADVRTKFPTVIRDVATTGNSGSGVFDAGSKCLLGIMSRKLVQRLKGADGGGGETDIAKYFVPASTIRTFILGAIQKLSLIVTPATRMAISGP